MKHAPTVILLVLLCVAPGAFADDGETTEAKLAALLEDAIERRSRTLTDMESRVEELAVRQDELRDQMESLVARGDGDAARKAAELLLHVDEQLAHAQGALATAREAPPNTRPLLEERVGAPVVAVFDVKRLIDAGVDVPKLFRAEAPGTAVVVRGRYAATAGGAPSRIRALLGLRPHLARDAEAQLLRNYDVRDVTSGAFSGRFLQKVRAAHPDVWILLDEKAGRLIVKGTKETQAAVMASLAEMRGEAPTTYNGSYNAVQASNVGNTPGEPQSEELRNRLAVARTRLEAAEARRAEQERLARAAQTEMDQIARQLDEARRTAAETRPAVEAARAAAAPSAPSVRALHEDVRALRSEVRALSDLIKELLESERGRR